MQNLDTPSSFRIKDILMPVIKFSDTLTLPFVMEMTVYTHMWNKSYASV